MTEDEIDQPETQVETELPRGPGVVVQLVPRPTPEATTPDAVHALTVEALEALLALAKKGEVHCLVAVSWHRGSPPQVHISTDDKIVALGALRTMEHSLVRDWLDGKVAGL